MVPNEKSMQPRKAEFLGPKGRKVSCLHRHFRATKTIGYVKVRSV